MLKLTLLGKDNINNHIKIAKGEGKVYFRSKMHIMCSTLRKL